VSLAELIGPNGQDGDDRLDGQVVDEKRQQVASRGIDPVDVLENRECRGLLAETPEQRDEPLEQAGTLGQRWLAGLGRRGRRVLEAETRQQAGKIRPTGTEDVVEAIRREIAGEAPEGLDDGQVRQPALADVEAGSVKDRRPVGAGPVNRLADEPALADACLATDEQDLRPPRGSVV
jgi:hypothetical protein